MPNWAIGSVTATGKRDGVISFIERFIDEDDGVTPGKRYFARSFLGESRKELIQQVRSDSEDECSATFTVSFAWSAFSCIISGYPEKSPEQLSTLEQACVEDGVAVEIRTDEPGICFCEIITCDEQGNLVSQCEDMFECRCKACGATFGIAPWSNPEEEECVECGHIGLEPVCSDDEKEDN